MTTESPIEYGDFAEMDFSFLNPDAALDTEDVTKRFKFLNNELARAQLWLRRARNWELQAYKAYCTARVPLLIHPDCPDPRKSGISKTQRDDWINDLIPDQWWRYQELKVWRMNGEDYLERLAEQVRITQSLGVNARLGLETTGRYS